MRERERKAAIKWEGRWRRRESVEYLWTKGENIEWEIDVNEKSSIYFYVILSNWNYFVIVLFCFYLLLRFVLRCFCFCIECYEFVYCMSWGTMKNLLCLIYLQFLHFNFAGKISYMHPFAWYSLGLFFFCFVIHLIFSNDSIHTLFIKNGIKSICLVCQTFLSFPPVGWPKNR